MKKYLFVIEGVDGSGKQTQSELLFKALADSGRKVKKISFPNYESESSSLVKMYLRGDFGSNPEDVNAYASSIFYAADRFASYRTDFSLNYNAGEIVIADRYTTSNMVHQASKIESIAKKEEFLDWLTNLEYGIFGIPSPNQVFFLDIDPIVSHELITSRANKFSHEREKDIHERDISYIIKSYENAKYVAQKYNWHIIECVEDGKLLSIQDIHAKLINAVWGYLK